ncbi:uncharacterized protein LOC135804640 isoform X2 [Sycon ciliatum]|uniref:uncharacterized protein LOC135804640 isoform X2 n=1 Tax=Sycon ciliatum TaxID=27933 RepID=UPI0031F6524A
MTLRGSPRALPLAVRRAPLVLPRLLLLFIASLLNSAYGQGDPVTTTSTPAVTTSDQSAPVTYHEDPLGCVGSACTYKLVGTVNVSRGVVDFEWTTGMQTNTWLALGVSNDMFMPNTDVIMGYWDGSTVQMSDRYATGYFLPPVDSDESQTSVFSGSQINGVTTIKFSRKCTSSDSKDISLQGNHHLIFAYGNVIALSIQQHRNTPTVTSGKISINCNPAATTTSTVAAAVTTSDATVVTTTATTTSTPAITYREDPPGCVGSACTYKLVGTVNVSRGVVDFEWTTGMQTNTWLALGVSNDMFMPNTDVIMGYWDGSSVQMSDRYATGYFLPPVDSDESQTSVFSGSQINGVTTIKFSRKCTSSDSKDISLQGNHHLIFAYGNVIALNIEKHPNTPTVTSGKISINCNPAATTTSTVAAAVTTSDATVVTTTATTTSTPAITYHEDPPGCVGSACTYKLVGTVNVSRGVVDFEWTTGMQTNTWLALGVSNDMFMPNTDVIMGYWDGSRVQMSDRYATGYFLPPVDSDESQTSVFSGSQINGVTTIKFSRKCTSSDSKDISLQGNHHLIFAYGNVIALNIEKHAITPTVTSGKISINCNPAVPTTTVAGAVTTSDVGVDITPGAVTTSAPTSTPRAVCVHVPSWTLDIERGHLNITFGLRAGESLGVFTSINCSYVSIVDAAGMPYISSIKHYDVGSMSAGNTSLCLISPNEKDLLLRVNESNAFVVVRNGSGLITTLGRSVFSDQSCSSGHQSATIIPDTVPPVVTSVFANMSSLMLQVLINENVRDTTINVTLLLSGGRTLDKVAVFKVSDIFTGVAFFAANISCMEAEDINAGPVNASFANGAFVDQAGVSNVAAGNLTVITYGSGVKDIANWTIDLQANSTLTVEFKLHQNEAISPSESINCSAVSIVSRAGTPYIQSLDGNSSVTPTGFVCRLTPSEAAILSGVNASDVQVRIGVNNGLTTTSLQSVASSTLCPLNQPDPIILRVCPPDVSRWTLDLGSGKLIATVRVRPMDGLRLFDSVRCNQISVVNRTLDPYVAGFSDYYGFLQNNETFQCKLSATERVKLLNANASNALLIIYNGSGLVTDSGTFVVTDFSCGALNQTVTILPDTVPPGLGNWHINLDRMAGNVTFNETLRDQAINLTLVLPGGNTSDKTAVHLGNSINGNSIYTYNLTCFEARSFYQGGVKISLHRGAVFDVAGNPNQASTDTDDHFSGPTDVKEWTLDLDAGIVAVNITNDVPYQLDKVDLQNFTCQSLSIVNGLGVPYVASISGELKTPSNRSSTNTFSCRLSPLELVSLAGLNQSDIFLAIPANSSDVSSTAGRNFHTVEQCPAPLSLLVPDSTLPRLVLAQANLSSSIGTVQFNEGIMENSVIVALSIVPLPTINATMNKFTPLSFSGVFNCDMWTALSRNASALAEIGYGAVSDLSGNKNRKQVLNVTIPDKGPPRIRTWGLDLNGPFLHVSLDMDDGVEMLNSSASIDCTSLTIGNSTGYQYATLTSPSGYVLSTGGVFRCPLDRRSKDAIATVSSPGDLSLVIGNQSTIETTAGRLVYTPTACQDGTNISGFAWDFTPPVLASAAADLIKSTVSLNFSETVQETSVNVTSFVNTIPNLVPLHTAKLNAADYTYSTNVTCSDLQGILSNNVTIQTSQVTDLSRNAANPNITVLVQVPLGSPMTYSNWTLNLDTSIVTVYPRMYNSEKIRNESIINCSQFYLVNRTSPDNVLVQLTGPASLLNGTRIQCSIPEDGKRTAASLSSFMFLAVWGTMSGVVSTRDRVLTTSWPCSQPHGASRVIFDSTRPAVKLVTAELSQKEITVSLAEDVTSSEINVTLTYRPSLNMSATYTARRVSVALFRFTFPCGPAERDDLVSKLSTWTVASGAFQDFSMNRNAAASGTITAVILGGPLEVDSWDLDLNTASLTVSVGLYPLESIDAAQTAVNCSALTILNSTLLPNTVVTLRGAGSVAASRRQITCNILPAALDSLQLMTQRLLSVGTTSGVLSTDNRTLETLGTCNDNTPATNVIPDITLPAVSVLQTNLITRAGILMFTETLLLPKLNFSLQLSPMINKTATENAGGRFTFPVTCSDRVAIVQRGNVSAFFAAGSYTDLGLNTNIATTLPVQLTSISPLDIRSWELDLNRGTFTLNLQLYPAESIASPTRTYCDGIGIQDTEFDTSTAVHLTGPVQAHGNGSLQCMLFTHQLDGLQQLGNWLLHISNASAVNTTTGRSISTINSCNAFKRVTKLVPDTTLPTVVRVVADLSPLTGFVNISETILESEISFKLLLFSTPKQATAKLNSFGQFEFNFTCQERTEIIRTPVTDAEFAEKSFTDFGINKNVMLTFPITIASRGPIEIDEWQLHLDERYVVIQVILRSDEFINSSSVIACNRFNMQTALGSYDLLGSGLVLTRNTIRCSVSLDAVANYSSLSISSVSLAVIGPTGARAVPSGRELENDTCSMSVRPTNITAPVHPSVNAVYVNLLDRRGFVDFSEEPSSSMVAFTLNGTGALTQTVSQGILRYMFNLSCTARRQITHNTVAIFNGLSFSDQFGWTNRRQVASVNITAEAPATIKSWSLDMERHFINITITQDSPNGYAGLDCSAFRLFEAHNSTHGFPPGLPAWHSSALGGSVKKISATEGQCQVTGSTFTELARRLSSGLIYLFADSRPLNTIPVISTDLCYTFISPAIVVPTVPPSTTSVTVNASSLELRFTFSERLRPSSPSFMATLMFTPASAAVPSWHQTVSVSALTGQAYVNCSPARTIRDSDTVQVHVAADAFYDVYGNGNKNGSITTTWVSTRNWTLDLDSGLIEIEPYPVPAVCSAVKIISNNTAMPAVQVISDNSDPNATAIQCSFFGNRDMVTSLAAMQQWNLKLSLHSVGLCQVISTHGRVILDHTLPVIEDAWDDPTAFMLTVRMSESIRVMSSVSLRLNVSGDFQPAISGSLLNSTLLSFPLTCSDLQSIEAGGVLARLDSGAVSDLSGNMNPITMVVILRGQQPEAFGLKDWGLDLNAGSLTLVPQQPSCVDTGANDCDGITLSTPMSLPLVVSGARNGISSYSRQTCWLSTSDLNQLKVMNADGSIYISSLALRDIYGQSVANFTSVSPAIVKDTTQPVMLQSSVVLLPPSASIEISYDEPLKRVTGLSGTGSGSLVIGSGQSAYHVPITVSRGQNSVRLDLSDTDSLRAAEIACSYSNGIVELNLNGSGIRDMAGNAPNGLITANASVNATALAQAKFNISRRLLNESIIDYEWQSSMTASQVSISINSGSPVLYRNVKRQAGIFISGGTMRNATVMARATFGNCGSDILVETNNLPPPTPGPSGQGGSSGVGAAAGGAAGGVIAIIIIVIIVIAIRKRNVSQEDDDFWGKADMRMGSRMTATNKMFFSDDAAAEFSRSRYNAGIAMEEFAVHTQRMHSDCDYPFTEEYELIRRWCTENPYPSANSSLGINQEKNRYRNITAYDHSRVELSVLDEMPGSDYINANYIQGYNRPDAFIAAQGPLSNTLDDFWRMVWEANSAVIVMVTNLLEQSKVKCEKYWPEEGVVVYGTIAVEMIEQEKFATYVKRTFSITQVSQASPDIVLSGSRTVTQMHFTIWPDHGVPTMAAPLLTFVRRVREHIVVDGGPTVIHCSAGVGRTGTLIAIYSEMLRIENESVVNVFGTVMGMRERRNLMVQTEHQYIFIHDALAELIALGDSSVPMDQLRKTIWRLSETDSSDRTGYATEMARLPSARPYPNKTVAALRPVNRNKNRTSVYVPLDSNRVRLPVLTGEIGSDYINASFIDGHKRQQALIATQHPLPSTVYDFWRMVWGTRAAGVVMLNAIDETETDMGAYWPEEGETSDFEALTVSVVNKYEQEHFIQRDIDIKIKTQAQMPAMAHNGRASMMKPNLEPLRIRHLQFKGWGTDTSQVPEVEDVLELLKTLYGWKLQCKDTRPVIIHCDHGADRTGTFAALYNMRERLMSEQAVDVFQTVRLLRFARYNMCSTESHYTFLYRVMLEYTESLPETSII